MPRSRPKKSAAGRLTRWTLGLSLLVAVVAAASGDPDPNLAAESVDKLLSSSPDQAVLRLSSASERAGEERTVCYSGLRTHASGRTSFDAPCFSFRDGKFSRVSLSREDVLGNGEGEVEVEVRRGNVIPGLWDGHGHLLQYGEFLHSVDIFGCLSVDEIVERLVRYLEAHPGMGTRGQWVRGVGWDQNLLGGMPTAEMLDDPRLGGRYIMLDRVDVHCTWVSGAVLGLLTREELEGEVPGGEIVRTPGMGVFCDNAMDLVLKYWERPGREEKKKFVRRAMAELNRVGVVGMHDAGVVRRDVELFRDMSLTEDEGWTVRVYAMMECAERNTFCPEEAMRVEQDGGMLGVRSVKLFADGALGSWGSAMIDPYSDRPDTSGSLLVNASTLTAVTKSWAQAGFQVNIHAIGDLANRYALDALESTLSAICSPDSPLKTCQTQNHRFRIEHAQIIHPDDQERMASLGIIPSIQPTHATSDMSYAESRLGPERTAKEAYRMKSLQERGLALVLGSDFPVEPPNPFEGVYAAVARKHPKTGGVPPGWEGRDGWHAEEALGVDEALAGFTTGPAFGGFMEGRAGVIKEGAWADWVVLDEVLEEVGVEELRHLKVRETWVGGRMVYSRDE
ncbi:amidohydrolase family-domain-containing protein [Echria macrotheca]|uniref:Amidohydrolase family-domain-containing protein n=1 Tax=Echria macrotheca TaxID=438768 RepID=A0AAJ0B391_9PEZI|nr:amidohydrolase family-domain-containing protein [Echria macrotheca]